MGAHQALRPPAGSSPAQSAKRATGVMGNEGSFVDRHGLFIQHPKFVGCERVFALAPPSKSPYELHPDKCGRRPGFECLIQMFAEDDADPALSARRRPAIA